MTPITDDRTDGRTNEGGIVSGRRSVHLGDLALRRLLAGESLGASHEADAAHAAGCADCRRRLEALKEEQQAFAERISFDRFSAGVERATRVPGPVPVSTPRRGWGRPATTRSFVTVMSAGALAAGFALFLGVRPLLESNRQRVAAEAEATRTNRLKGGDRASIVVRIAPADEGAQRSAAVDAPEKLALGDRLRVGVQRGTHAFLFAVSLDDRGVVTPLYPEVGTSLPLPRAGGVHYLPDSLELTGKGGERLIVLLTDEPLDLETIRRAAEAAFVAAGKSLARLPHLALPGDQFHRLFIKP